jgi:hypothetical protein
MKDQVRARIQMFPSADGGLLVPLRTPTQSLQFRPAGDDRHGLVGVIILPGGVDLQAGQSWDDARVHFPIDETDSFIQPGRTFELWNLRAVGTAEILG